MLQEKGILHEDRCEAFAWTTKFGQSHLHLLSEVREHGIEGFEIPMFVPADLATLDIRRASEAADIECTVCAILPEGINPISPDAAVRKLSHAHLLRCIETSAQLGAHLMGGPLFAPIGYLPGRRRNKEEWKWAVEAFQSLGDLLDANDMTLSIEPVNRSETFFLTSATDARTLCDEVGHPRIGVTIDTFHANIEEKNITDAARFLGKHLKHVHASENDRGLLGSGHVDFPEILTGLRDIGYDGYLMIEGFGYSRDEQESLGALYGDLTVSPENIAFEGATYLWNLLR